MQGARRFAISHKRRLLYGACGILAFGYAVGGYLLYYERDWIRNYHKRKLLRYEPPPVRRTPLYVAGKSGTPELPLVPRSMPRLVFYVFVLYRIALLFVNSIPIMWYAMLTFVFHTCSRHSFYEQVYQFLTNMGPSYIKLGQWIATRPDVFPNDFCAAMEKLYDQTSAHKWSHTEKLLRTRLTEGPFAGRTPLEFLTEIERKPVNSGSIAQIHRATLRETMDNIPAGTQLAIKVSHPHITESMAADVAAMKLFVRIANALVPGLKSINLNSAVREFAKLIQSQLNLLIEADNLRQFTYNFREVNGIIFPKPLMSLCSEEVLFETYEEGESLQTVKLNEDTESVAELGCHMFLKMLFEDNFVHSDLHPGNIFLRHNTHLKKKSLHNSNKAWPSLFLPHHEYYPDGKRKMEYEIIVLDAGLVTTLSRRERNNFISLFAAVACGDGELGAELMLDRMPRASSSSHNKKKNKEAQDEYAMTPEARKRFTSEMKEIFDLVAPGTSGFRLSNVQIGAVLAKILNTVRENKAPLDGNFAALVLTVIVGEGLGRRLSPEFNIFSESAPYLVAFLEEGELYFLANKLRETYGTPALLRESMYFVQPTRTNVYMKMAAKRGSNTTRKLLIGETKTENSTNSNNNSSDEDNDNVNDYKNTKDEEENKHNKEMLDHVADKTSERKAHG